MKKLIILCLVLSMAYVCSLSAFATEASVPVAPGGALDPNESATALTEAEKALRVSAYNEILALSQTDPNIIGVQLSEDSRWVFWSVSGESETVKEYTQRFPQYAEFLILTDDVAGQNISDDTAEGAKPAHHPSQNYWLAGLLVMVLLFVSFGVLHKKRLVPVMQTANGQIATTNTSISTSEVVLAVKKSETTPAAKVFRSILNEIDKTDS